MRPPWWYVPSAAANVRAGPGVNPWPTMPRMPETLTIKSLPVAMIVAHLEKSLQASRSAELRADDGCGCVRQPSALCLLIYETRERLVIREIQPVMATVAFLGPGSWGLGNGIGVRRQPRHGRKK